MDYRKRAVEYRDEGHTFKELREAFGIPSETYYGWKEKFDSGYYETPIKRERKRKIDKEQLKQAAAVFYALEKLDITRKKSLSPITKNQRSGGRNTARR